VILVLDDNTQMVQGQQYTAHLVSDGFLGVYPDQASVTTAFDGDGNFSTPVYSVSTSSLDVTFVYFGVSSTVGNAGSEIANIINANKNLVSDSVSYKGMDSGISVSSPVSASVLPSGNTGLWIIGGFLLLAILLVGMGITRDVKEIA
jgi:hypothetical protein